MDCRVAPITHWIGGPPAAKWFPAPKDEPEVVAKPIKPPVCTPAVPRGTAATKEAKNLRIIDFVRERGSITVRQSAALIGEDRNAAGKRLRGIAKAGRLILTEESRAWTTNGSTGFIYFLGTEP